VIQKEYRFPKILKANRMKPSGYKVTKRNMHYLKKWKSGKSIGFTMRSSLKAKGLIPRANGKIYKSEKYKTYKKIMKS